MCIFFQTEKKKNPCYCAGKRTMALENKRKGATFYGGNQERLQSRNDLKR